MFLGGYKYSGPRFSPGRRIQCDFFTASLPPGEGSSWGLSFSMSIFGPELYSGLTEFFTPLFKGRPHQDPFFIPSLMMKYINRAVCSFERIRASWFIPLEIMPRSSAIPLYRDKVLIIPPGFDPLLEFLTGFTVSALEISLDLLFKSL